MSEFFRKGREDYVRGSLAVSPEQTGAWHGMCLLRCGCIVVLRNTMSVDVKRCFMEKIGPVRPSRFCL
jgi:hypothetical protein